MFSSATDRTHDDAAVDDSGGVRRPDAHDREVRAASNPAGPFGSCPAPRSQYDCILLGHGSGGRLTAEACGSAPSW